MRYLFALFAAAMVALGVSHANAFTFTLTPIAVCEDDGSNCTRTSFDLGAVNSILAPANISVDLAPEIELRDSGVLAAPSVFDYLVFVRGTFETQIGTDEIWFAFGPLFLPDDMFSNAFLAGPGFVLRDTTETELETIVMARSIGLMLGLFNCEAQFDGMCDGNLMASTRATIGAALLPEQIETMRQSPLLEADPIPLPAAAWVFLTGLAGLAGWRKTNAA
ncbi:MAG: hypothetical protein AAFR65_15780 [Pseudomonadota bacterium]